MNFIIQIHLRVTVGQVGGAVFFFFPGAESVTHPRSVIAQYCMSCMLVTQTHRTRWLPGSITNSKCTSTCMQRLSYSCYSVNVSLGSIETVGTRDLQTITSSSHSTQVACHITHLLHKLATIILFFTQSTYIERASY